MKSFFVAILAVAISLLFSGCDGCAPQQLNGWEKLTVTREGAVNIHGMAVNSEGVLLAFGHTEENYDCGVFDLGDCRMFKIFRSTNMGTTWVDISNVEIGKRHSFLKGDKVSPWKLRRLGGVISGGKMIIDEIVYTDYDSKGSYYATGKNFYMYIDQTLYCSADNGISWEQVYITDNYVLPDYDDSTVKFIDDYLAVHSIYSANKYLFKRYGKTFIYQDRDDFAVVHKNGKSELVFDNGNNLASEYNFGKDWVVRRVPGRSISGKDALAEFFVFNKGLVVSNSIAVKDSVKRHFALLSKDSGKTFKLDHLPSSVTSNCIHGLKVLGTFKGKLLAIKRCEDFNVGAEKITDKRFVRWSNTYLLWDVSKKKTTVLWLPSDGSTSFHEFCITNKYLFYYSQNGIYRKEKFN